MNRKKFLRLGITSLTVAPLLSKSFAWSLEGTSSSNPLIKKSLKFGMIKEGKSVYEKFKLVKKLGFDGVELDSPNSFKIDEVLEAKKQTGLEIPGVVNSMHWQAPLSDPDPKVRQECVDSMKIALADCKAYGGSTVLLVPAIVNEKVAYDDAYRRSQEEIRKLLPVAKETGIKIAFENVWNNFLLSPMEAARYVDELESSMVGWYFDVGNVIRYAWPEHWIRILGKRILKVDIKEYSREKQNEEGLWKGFDVEIGEGDCNWKEVNNALRDIGYQGWGSGEVIGGGEERLHEIASRMDKVFSL